MNIFTEEPFDPVAETPLYQQLYGRLQRAILAGRLPGGHKLPSTHALADELMVSRNTVLTAYDQLTAEGYIESVEGSGTFVADVLPEQLLTPAATLVQPAPKPRRLPADRPQLSQRAQAMLTSPQISPLLPACANGRPRPFSLGMSALDAFPYQLWSRLVARRARQLSIGTLTYQEPAGYLPLHEAIAAHLTVSRSVRCTSDQIVIVAGAQGGFDLAARMLLNQGDPVWMEDPGYVGARRTFGCGGRDRTGAD